VRDYQDLCQRLRARQVPNWIHATGQPPKQNGFKPDPTTHAAADAIEELIDAVWKACGDNEEAVRDCIESQQRQQAQGEQHG